MFGEPINDVACLSTITDEAMEAAETEAMRNLASRFETTAELARWLRSLPQRNDTGDPADGPRVDCDVPQRLRFAAEDPNCVERSATYMAAAELIDPAPLRQLATIHTPRGRHTFPVEDDAPVKLDPLVPRNALEAGLFRMGEPDYVDLSAREALRWIGAIAAEPAGRYRNGRRRIRNAQRALLAASRGKPMPRNAAGDVGFALALAEQAARMFGVRGMEVVKMGTLALNEAFRRRNRRPAPRNVSLAIGGVRIEPDLGTLAGLARVGGRLGMKVGSAVVRSQLERLGIGSAAIAEIERELNREGMSLGPVARSRPQPGTLASMATRAIAARRAT